MDSPKESIAPVKKVGNLEIFFRLTRFQFLPLILLPASLGAALAYRYSSAFNLGYFLLVILGVALLHLGANSIDDCYDYENGVDAIANSLFPPNFGGWKPLPRRYISLAKAKMVSVLLFLASILISIYFWVFVGYWSFIFAIGGTLLAIFYTAPPLKLDYRGKGLGEVAILLAFGPIPVLGSFYVQIGTLNLSALLISVAVGIMTVTILIDHDLIFYEVYRQAKKFSLGAVLGRSRALTASLFLTIVSYALVFISIGLRILPITSIIAPIISAAILARKSGTFRRANEQPPFYVPFTANALLADWMFTLILAITAALPPH